MEWTTRTILEAPQFLENERACFFHYIGYIQQMLKTGETVKSLEDRAINAVKDLLRGMPRIEVKDERNLDLSYDVDGLVDLRYAGKNYVIAIEVKSNGAPRFVRLAIYQLKNCIERLQRSGEANGRRRLVPMLVCPYLSPQSRATCTEHNVAYLDLAGNTRLAFDTVYIERAVAEKPRSETRALRSIFTPKAAAILRVLLRDPNQAWRVADLAEQANASYGHVSNVRKALLEREWLDVRDDGAVLIQPDALLNAWRENYRRPAGLSITGCTHLHGTQLTETLRGKLNPHAGRPRAIYSLHSAAQWLAPFGRGGAHTFYADESGAEALKNELMLTPAEGGANVIIHIPTDESLFDDASEPATNVFCTSPIVAYLDLWSGSDRDREAAEHLAREFFQWMK